MASNNLESISSKNAVTATNIFLSIFSRKIGNVEHEQPTRLYERSNLERDIGQLEDGLELFFGHRLNGEP